VIIGKPIRVKSPTGSGKTAVIVGLTEGLKYGETPNDEKGVLILVPRKDILDQTVKAFDTFSGTIRPSVYFGEKKELGKVTVMTYQSFNKAYKAGIITREMFDAVVRDESHRARGEETDRNLRHFIHGGKGDKPKAVFDLSATPKVSQESLHYSKTVVEGISEGILSPVAARRIFTGASIEELEDYDFRDDFSKGEVRSLIHNRERNEIIVREILSGLRSGRRTIVRCLPGQDLLHTRIIEQMIAEQGAVPILNPYMEDRERRPPNVVIVRGDMPIDTRRKIYKIFGQDMNFDLDVLLFVETMTEGWDGPIAKKLINASPCRAEWVVEQLFGRVLRPYKRHSGKTVAAQAIDLIDNSLSGQKSFTDILDRDAPEGMRYREGVVVGKELADLADPQRIPRGAFELIA
jgi:superfamily II DNA or RNA helicase